MLEDYIVAFRRTGILLDTNLLLFFALASYDIEFAEQFKQTRMYDRRDFETLNAFLSFFERVLTTPQVLGEVWHFIEPIREPRLSSVIQSLVDYLLVVVESYVEKDVILKETYLPYVGITDVSVICSAKRTGCLVLTDDLRAYNYYLINSVEALNINHFRFA